MKPLKALVPAAIALLALASFGAGSASATVLCKTSVNPCPEGWDYAAGTELSLSMVGTATNTSTTTGTTYTTCSGGSVKGSTSSTGSGTTTVSIPIEKANWTWTGCSATTDSVAGGTLEIHWISETSNGTVTSSGAEWTENIFGSCIYGTENTDLGTLVGSSTTPVLTIHTVVKRKNACLGPAEREFNATYHVTSPTPLFVEGQNWM